MNKEELIKKVKALAESGIGGEKVNAQKLIEKLMLKYNISDTDLNEEEVQEFEFANPKFFNSKSLINQVIYSVIGDINEQKGLYTIKRNKSKFIIKCTHAEFIEFEAKFKFYSQFYKKELELFYRAFIHANKIFPTLDKVKQKESTYFLNDEDMKVFSLAKTLDKHDYLLQIEGGN